MLSACHALTPDRTAPCVLVTGRGLEVERREPIHSGRILLAPAPMVAGSRYHSASGNIPAGACAVSRPVLANSANRNQIALANLPQMQEKRVLRYDSRQATFGGSK